MRDSVDHHVARGADALAAVVIESDGLFPCENESFIKHIEHFRNDMSGLTSVTS
jgi:hypothetical protein